MTDFVVTFDAGQRLPDGTYADEAYMMLEATDRTDLDRQLWDLLGEHRGQVLGIDDAHEAIRGRWEVLPGEWLAVEQCGSCRARVIRGLRRGNLTTAFVDVAVDPAGTVVLQRNQSNRAAPLVRKLAVSARFGRHDLRTLHRCKQSHHAKSVHS